ncbi:hypothetical protein C8R47DRAFT_130306 [Mycena vitilis]|nr:hypothetical protein C8R47DRAFT_130306 [Mycena vitilis]
MACPGSGSSRRLTDWRALPFVCTATWRCGRGDGFATLDCEHCVWTRRAQSAGCVSGVLVSSNLFEQYTLVPKVEGSERGKDARPRGYLQMTAPRCGSRLLRVHAACVHRIGFFQALQIFKVFSVASDICFTSLDAQLFADISSLLRVGSCTFRHSICFPPCCLCFPPCCLCFPPCFLCFPPCFLCFPLLPMLPEMLTMLPNMLHGLTNMLLGLTDMLHVLPYASQHTASYASGPAHCAP